jgi:uncharacterized membrane protein YGL010W
VPGANEPPQLSESPLGQMAEPLVLLNYAFVAVVFTLLLGATVSQRARVGLCWVAIPGLIGCVATKLLRTYDTVDELTFYASYHSHPMNQLVHIVCVPLLLFTVFVFAAYVPPPIKAMPQLTWPLLGACAWSLHHVRAAPLVGSIVSCLTFAMALAATAIVERERRTSNRSFVEFHVGDRVHVLEPAKFAGNVGTVVKRDATEGSVVVRLEGSTVTLEALHSQLQGFGEFRAGDRVRTLGAGTYGFAAFYAGLVHVFCWYAQIHPGHGIYEGRKPALLDSALQSFLDAPLFVWYEVAFACGYDPALKQELDAAVVARHAAWDL